ncbi:MAG: L-2-amino-thiazoline-4-carboxylic acid hydrolase [Lachnospiraceae bacterium]|nr:L-2-amino-thiazoline-4-carboxylic acid hydrolase [Lachnospiraceae bacterium]
MTNNHVQITDLPYCEPIREWLKTRYGESTAAEIWKETEDRYNEYLIDLPDYGGRKNVHAMAIYGGLIVFSIYPLLPDQPPVSEIQDFVANLFMGPFVKLGKVIDLNRPFDMWLINKVFQKTGDGDRRDISKYPESFINVGEPYDKDNHIARYSFTQCPNAEFAKKHDLLHVLPVLCNSDFFGIEQLHGTLIRCGTCGNSDHCDYCVVGNRNPMAKEYDIETDDKGFIVSRKK